MAKRVKGEAHQYERPIGPEPRPHADLRQAICSSIRQGITPLQAALVEDVSELEFAEWLRRGHAGHEPYATLLHEIARAEAEAELVIVGRIKVAAKDSWQAGAWLAERRWPERYARKSIQGDEAPRPPVDVPRGHEDPFAELDNVTELRPARGRPTA